MAVTCSNDGRLDKWATLKGPQGVTWWPIASGSIQWALNLVFKILQTTSVCTSIYEEYDSLFWRDLGIWQFLRWCIRIWLNSVLSKLKLLPFFKMQQGDEHTLPGLNSAEELPFLFSFLFLQLFYTAVNKSNFGDLEVTWCVCELGNPEMKSVSSMH